MLEEDNETAPDPRPAEDRQVAEIDDIETLKKTLAAEKEKAEKYLANWQRAEADLQNYRKRVEQERSDQSRFANAMIIASILPVLDDLERALSNVSATLAGLNWVDGIRLIYRKLQSTLQAQGVTPIETEGRDFDPNVHEAVLYSEGEEGKVIEELQKGYKLHDRVLRPAMVKVGKGFEQPKPAGETQ